MTGSWPRSPKMPILGTFAACCAVAASGAARKPRRKRAGSRPLLSTASVSSAPPAPQHRCWSLDHLVGADEDGRREGEPQGLGGLHIDHQFEARGLLHGQVRWLGAFQDLVHVGGGAPVEVGELWRVGHEAPRSTN